MSDETEQISDEYASSGDDKQARKGCVGCGCDEKSAPATTVHVSTSVGNIYFNLSMTVLDDVPESRPLDTQLLKAVMKLMFNELRHNYAISLQGQKEKAHREILEKMTDIGKAFASSFRKAQEARGEGKAGEEQPAEVLMSEQTQAEVGRRINNLFKKDGRE